MAFLIKLCLWALAFVPLIVNSSVFFPFIFGKTLMIRIFISLVSLLFTVHLFANEEFRGEMWGKLKRVAKNPLFISATSLIVIMAIGSYFAISPFRAFFGDVERGEGLLGWLYFYGFFIYSLFIFEKKDWVTFFRLNLITSVTLFIKEVAEYAGPGSRPGSFTGNPEFLASYFLFTIFASLIGYHYSDKKKEPLWKVFSVITVLISLVGLLMTETRGALLGLVVGIFSLVVYGFFHGKSVYVRGKATLRAVSMWLLIAMIAIGGIFFVTKSSPVWQKIPGFARVAQFSFGGQTVQTRLISAGVSIKAIEPSTNGWKRTLLGWGQENFSIAYNAHYNPLYYHLEHTWFDRAHNKIMDVAVMEGLLGLLAYLAIWASIAWFVFRKKGFSVDMMLVLFFASTFFVNLLFLFDQISTAIPLFAFFAFVVHISAIEGDALATQAVHKKKGASSDEISPKEYVAYGAAIVTTLFFLWGLIVWTVVPMSQMTSYLGAISDNNIGAIMQQPDAVFEPYTFAQQDIRSHFLNIVMANYGNPQIKPVFDLALAKMEELVQIEPSNPRYLLLLGGAYDRMGKTDNKVEDFKKAEEYYQRALVLAPMRQDTVYAYAMNLSYQGRYKEAEDLLRKEIAVDPLSPETHYYLGVVLMAGRGDYKESLKELEIAMQSPTFTNTRDEFVKNLYSTMLKRTYQDHDKDRFLIVANRMQTLDPKQAEKLKQIEEVVKKGQWPIVNFQQ